MKPYLSDLSRTNIIQKIHYSSIIYQDLFIFNNFGVCRTAAESGGHDSGRKSRQKKWQSCKDSNLNKMNQNHLCYRYTTGLRGFII